jgi:hypothetical protein
MELFVFDSAEAGTPGSIKNPTKTQQAADLLVQNGYTIESQDGYYLRASCALGHKSRFYIYNVLKGHMCRRCELMANPRHPPSFSGEETQIGDVKWVKSLGMRGGHHVILARNVRTGLEREILASRFRTGKETLCNDEDLRRIAREAGKKRRKKPNGCAKHTWVDVLCICEKEKLKFVNPPENVTGAVHQTTQRGLWTFECRCGATFSASINSILFGRTRSCGCIKSFAEGEIAGALQSAIPGIVVVRNDRTQLAGKMELDLWLPEYGVGIEYNGLWCHGEAWTGLEGRQKHLKKLMACREGGIRLVTIFEDEWTLKRGVVVGYLISVLGRVEHSIGARKLLVSRDGPIRQFVQEFHLQGAGGGGEEYGLVDASGSIQAAAIFARPNASRNAPKHEGVWELSRLCVRPGVSVPGGASRLITAWQKRHPEAVRLVSYSDNRWSEGNLYLQTGFRLEKENPPSYWYFEKDTIKRFHRFKWRKSIALKTFGGIEGDTEWSIMSRNGWDRIWDCGTRTWILELG